VVPVHPGNPGQSPEGRKMNVRVCYTLEYPVPKRHRTWNKQTDKVQH